MSTWGTIDAHFTGDLGLIAEHAVKRVPTGSESGPKVEHIDADEAARYSSLSEGWKVSGRLRDVSDLEHSPAVLAWFTAVCSWSASEADLLWEIDGGPRYRYQWRDGELRRLRGVLE